MDLDEVTELKKRAGLLFKTELLRQAARAGYGHKWICPPSLGIYMTLAGTYGLAIRVQEREDLPDEAFQEIFRQAHGDVDFKVTGPIRLFSSNLREEHSPSQVRPLRPGLPISQAQLDNKDLPSSGRLGCFVRKKDELDKCLILSNAHVIANPSRAENSPIVQPTHEEGGVLSEDTIAHLRKYEMPVEDNENFLDAAIAEIDKGISYDLEIYPVTGICKASWPTQEMSKLGYPSVTGQVTGIDFSFKAKSDDSYKELKFVEQIEISGLSAELFAESGDSGSIVVNKEGEAVGLLIAGSSHVAEGYEPVCYMTPIQTVLDKLGVELILGGGTNE